MPSYTLLCVVLKRNHINVMLVVTYFLLSQGISNQFAVSAYAVRGVTAHCHCWLGMPGWASSRL